MLSEMDGFFSARSCVCVSVFFHLPEAIKIGRSEQYLIRREPYIGDRCIWGWLLRVPSQRVPPFSLWLIAAWCYVAAIFVLVFAAEASGPPFEGKWITPSSMVGIVFPTQDKDKTPTTLYPIMGKMIANHVQVISSSLLYEFHAPTWRTFNHL